MSTPTRTADSSSGAMEELRCGRHQEGGFVLATVLFALVVIEVLVAVAFVSGVYALRTGSSMVAFQQARAVAEAGVVWRVMQWDSASYEALALGDSAAFSGSPSIGSGSYEGNVLRLGNRMFLVRARGMGTNPGVTGEHGLLIRVDSGGVGALPERAVVQPF